MRLFKKSKRGSAFVWIIVMIGIFAVGLLYMLLTYPISVIQNKTWSQVEEQGDYAQTYNSVVLMWKYWPLFAIFGLILGGIIVSLKREPYSGYNGP